MTVKRIRLGGFTSWPIQSGEDRVFKTGEAAIDTETGVIKVGNGEDPFSDLPAAGGGGSAVSWSEITDKPSTFPATIVSAPESAAASGTAGQIATDTDYLYVCIATDTWVRSALDAWS